MTNRGMFTSLLAATALAGLPATAEADVLETVVGTVDGATGQLLDQANGVVGGLAPGPQGAAPGGGTSETVEAPSVRRDDAAAQVPPLSFALGAPRLQRARSTSRRGLTASSRCSHACGVLVQLTAPRYTAKRLRLGRRALVVGSAGNTKRSGRFTVKLRPRARKALTRYFARRANRGRRVRFRVAAVAFDAAGRPTSVRSRTVTLKR